MVSWRVQLRISLYSSLLSKCLPLDTHQPLVVFCRLLWLQYYLHQQALFTKYWVSNFITGVGYILILILFRCVHMCWIIRGKCWHKNWQVRSNLFTKVMSHMLTRVACLINDRWVDCTSSGHWSWSQPSATSPVDLFLPSLMSPTLGSHLFLYCYL